MPDDLLRYYLINLYYLILTYKVNKLRF